jgi:hypothetical protein
MDTARANPGNPPTVQFLSFLLLFLFSDANEKRQELLSESGCPFVGLSEFVKQFEK